MDYGSGLVIFKERVIWWLSRIVENLAMSTGWEENLITSVERNTVSRTGSLVEAGTTYSAQTDFILYAQRNN